MKKVDITNQRFGRLIALKRCERPKGHPAVWLCLCDCGNYKEVTLNHLRRGTKSCGCLSKEIAPERAKLAKLKERAIKHGDFGTKLYGVWAGMKRRCNNPNVLHYEDYGGRGIKVCDSWNDYINFKEWAISSGYKEGLTLDRIDVDGNYEPSNCRWVGWHTQQRNRRNTVKIEYEGRMVTMQELSEITGIKAHTLDARRRGCTIEQIVDNTLHVNAYR